MMLTPQEVSQHAFAKASFGGYNMAMVDEFLDALTEDYTVLYKENAVLKSKMKVLVDKVEEYRSTDESMRKAFLVAQKSAEDIVTKAEAERETMMKAAETEAHAKIAGLRRELEDEKLRLTSAQNATAAYIAKVQTLCRQELDYLNTLPKLTTPPPTREDKAAHEIESSMQKIVEDETPVPQETMDLDRELEQLRVTPAAPEKPAGGLYAEIVELNIAHKAEGGKREQRPRHDEEPDSDLDLDLDLDLGAEAERASRPDDTSPTRSIDFDNLQFGKDYEIQ